MNLDLCYKLYEMMVYLRLTEEAIALEYPKNNIKTPVHLYVGQEAIAAGVSVHLQEKDRVMSNHRSHGHSLAKGLPLKAFFAELYGKSAGVSRGYGGSMHLIDTEKGVLGTSAIVAGGIPIGAGSALSQQINREPYLTVIYFGDGAVDEGVFWETVNFAGLKKLPILFVMEDNQYASQTHSRMRHAYDNILKAVSEFKIQTYDIDGNDALLVSETAQKAMEWIRAGKGPAFIRCETYRWMGHVGVVDDSASGYRSFEEVEKWRRQCPVRRMETLLAEHDPDNYENAKVNLYSKYQNMIQEAIQYAEEMPYAVD